MNESLKFSVLIPYYNEGEKVIPTIQSLQAQSYANWELVCVNDGSTDNTLDILTSLAISDPRIRIVTKENEGLPAKAINYGIRYLSGDYYFYSSKDDSFDKDFLKTANDVLQLRKYDALVPNLYMHYEDHDWLFFNARKMLGQELTGERAAELCAYNCKVSPNAFYKVSIVKSIGCFTFSYNSDEYTGLVYLKSCENVGFCCSSFYYNQCDPNAYTKKVSLKELTQFETNIRILELFKDSIDEELKLFLKNKNLLFWTSFMMKCVKDKNLLQDRKKRQKLKEIYWKYRNSILEFESNEVKYLILKMFARSYYMFFSLIKIYVLLKKK